MGDPNLAGSAGFALGRRPLRPLSQRHPPCSPPPTKSSGGTALKIVLVVAGVLFVFGAIAAGGIYYTAHRYVKFAEDVTGVKASDVVNTVREAAKHPSDASSGRKRDGCALLSKDEAAAILGLEVERVDGKPSDQESGEHCDYFVKPGSIEENAEKVKQAAAAIPNDSKSDAGQLPPESIDMIKAMHRGIIEGARNGEAHYFGFSVERENGKIACTALKIATRLGGGDITTSASAEPLGVGDQAVMGMGESRLCVVRGAAAVTLDLSQVTGGRAKGIALAKTILSRL
jgi:hypothetical protein